MTRQQYTKIVIDNTDGIFPYPEKMLKCYIKTQDLDKIFTENDCGDLEIDPIKVFNISQCIE